MADEQSKVREIRKRLSQLEQLRKPYEPMIDEVIEYVNHGRRSISGNEAKGRRTGQQVYDGTAISAAQICANGLFGYMVAPSIRWFGLTLPVTLNFPRAGGMRSWSGKKLDEYPGVKEWLQDYEDVLYASFQRSNFYEVMPGVIYDAVTIGTVHPYCEEDVKTGRVVFQQPHFRECYFAEDQHGRVDTLYRKYPLTLKQLVEKFGERRLTDIDPNIGTGLENNPFAEKTVIHAIEPRIEYDKNILNSKNKPWASYWLFDTGEKLLSESGYDEFPHFTWRWWKNNDEICGRSPAWQAYADIMIAQSEGKSNLVAGQKMAEPPMVGIDKLRGLVNNRAKGWTWVEDMQDIPRPLLEGIQLPYALELQERRAKIIKEAFYVDFFLMLSQAAFQNVDLKVIQIMEMQGEKAAILGVMIGRMQAELLDPVIDRVAGIEGRAGRLPVPPDIVLEHAGERIDVDYLGPLAQAQKRLFKVQSIKQGLELAGAIASVSPTSLRRVNWDKAMQIALEESGFPAECIFDDETIKRINAEIERQQQAQAALQGAAEIAKALPGAAKAAEPGSPLEALMGAAQQ
jgi:hypothetical protein